jgi:hypothetical protein
MTPTTGAHPDRGRDAARRAQARQDWAILGDGFEAIAPGLEESYRRARDGMILAWSKPKANHYHSWRRYVKDHWFHVRLLEDNCGNICSAYQRRIEALDGVLGEYHNLVILRECWCPTGYTATVKPRDAWGSWRDISGCSAAMPSRSASGFTARSPIATCDVWSGSGRRAHAIRCSTGQGRGVSRYVVSIWRPAASVLDAAGDRVRRHARDRRRRPARTVAAEDRL